jgi:hypothetical protein
MLWEVGFFHADKLLWVTLVKWLATIWLLPHVFSIAFWRFIASF